jgi:hypothetical protein
MASDPFSVPGDDRWQKAMVARLDLMHTIRSEGRPKKNPRPEN